MSDPINCICGEKPVFKGYLLSDYALYKTFINNANRFALVCENEDCDFYISTNPHKAKSKDEAIKIWNRREKSDSSFELKYDKKPIIRMRDE